MSRRRHRRLQAAAEAIGRLTRLLFAKNSELSLPEEPAHSLALAVRGFFGAPVLGGNDIALLVDAEAAFRQMIKDVDAATKYCDMEYYIWSDGGLADEFGEALLRAVGRGVRCRLLVDQIGSARFLQGKMARKLKKGGVDLRSALPAGPVQWLFARPDLRMHRKILIVDEATAYTGSLNLADPQFFMREAGVGQWVDAFCRVLGPSVQALSFVFLSDWTVETGGDLLTLEKEFPFVDRAEKKNAKIQCLPSGPSIKNSAIEEVLIMAIYSARRRLVLTTPYFVPSEAMLYALISSARRGVEVILIVPARGDSILTQYASRAFFAELTEGGVKIALYQGGMLHTKSVVIDEEFAIFGSLNLDPRSLRINFEITLAIYEREFAQALSELQKKYLKQSQIVTVEFYKNISRWEELKEDLARLASPLL